MIQEKIHQTIAILKEKGVDLWLTFVRESDTVHDPSLDFILGTSVTWQSAFMISAKGETVALVGSLDETNIRSRGLYAEVIGYVESIKDPLLGVLKRLNPQKIAINYSLDSPLGDGLTHGMYELLMGYLSGTPFAEKIISADGIIGALRGRKSPAELDRIKAAIKLTLDMFSRVSGFIQPGRTEKEIAGFLKEELKKAGVTEAWDPDYCPSVFTGPESAGAHAGPTDRKVEGGHILNIDFGIKLNDYCSDLQRTWYILRDGESEPPAEVMKAFNGIRDAIERAAEALKPGVEGWMVDKLARDYLVSLGYEEYPHALGHQIGRFAHDGKGLLCPKWDRYGKLPFDKVEEGQVYTIEPRCTVKGYGVATIEEIVVVTGERCEFLSPPQTEIYVV